MDQFGQTFDDRVPGDRSAPLPQCSVTHLDDTARRFQQHGADGIEVVGHGSDGHVRPGGDRPGTDSCDTTFFE